MKVNGTHTGTEYIQLAQQHKKEIMSLIAMHDDDETFEIVGTAWWAKYSSVNTPEKMLACIYHLSSKRWITLDHIRALLLNFKPRLGFNIDCFDAMA